MSTTSTIKIKRLLFAGDDQIPLLTGLMWRALPPNDKFKSLPKVCRDANAKMVCTVQIALTNRTSLDNSEDEDEDGEAFGNEKERAKASFSAGLFIPKPQEEGINLPVKTLSAAAGFASEVGAEFPNAVLILSLPDDLYYVIALADGSPTADFIDHSDQFTEIVKHAQVIYSDNSIIFPGSTQVSLDWLAEVAVAHEKTAKLVKSPRDPKILMTFGVVCILSISLAGGLFYLTKKNEQLKREAEAKAKRETDPGPKYAAMLKIAKTRMFYTHESMLDAWKKLNRLPVNTYGWLRDDINCDMNLAQVTCQSQWTRKGGTNENLVEIFNSSEVSEKIDAINSLNTEAVSLNVIKTSFQFSLENEAELNSNGDLNQRFKLDTQEKWLRKVTPILQELQTAGYGVKIDQPLLWPVAPGVPAGYLPKSNGIKSMASTINVDGSVTEDFLNSMPSDFNWTGIRVDLKHIVSTGGDKQPLLHNVTVNFFGVAYVAME